MESAPSLSQVARLLTLLPLRARRAQYPITLLTSKPGFAAAVSAETRKMVAATVYVAVGKMKVQMEMLEEVISKEVTRQFALRFANTRFENVVSLNNPREKEGHLKPPILVRRGLVRVPLQDVKRTRSVQATVRTALKTPPQVTTKVRTRARLTERTTFSHSLRNALLKSILVVVSSSSETIRTILQYS
jgi:hypothetical protein